MPPAAVGAAPLRRAAREPARCVSSAWSRSTRRSLQGVVLCWAWVWGLCCLLAGDLQSDTKAKPKWLILFQRLFAWCQATWGDSRIAAVRAVAPVMSLPSAVTGELCGIPSLSKDAQCLSCLGVPTDVSSLLKWVLFSSQQSNRGKAWLSFASGLAK